MAFLENIPDFDFDGGELSLDFANTANWHAREDPEERLNSYQDLVAWGFLARLLNQSEAQRLLQIAKEHPQRARAPLKKAVALREAIYRIFVNRINQEAPSREDLDILNDVLHRALPHLRLVRSGQDFDFAWKQEAEDLEQIIYPVAWSAAKLLNSDELDRVGQCADDRGCGYLFYDTSRNHSRRWCSMEACGNRAKAMRHYERKTA